MAQPRRPPGPDINLVLAVIGQMFPSRFPFDPLAFGTDIAHQFGDIAHYQVGPLHVYQLTHPDFARQILIEEPEKFHKAPRLLTPTGFIFFISALDVPEDSAPGLFPAYKSKCG